MRLDFAAFTLAIVTACATTLSACAGVRVYSDPALTHETGVKVFAPKPYLLVARTGAKNAAVQVSIVYLPDINEPSYIRQQRGWGSTDFSVGIQNGMLVQLGSKADSHLPETLGAVGDLLTAAGTVYADSRPRGSQEPVEPEGTLFELYEIHLEHGRTTLVRVAIDGTRR
jgi:hypothetical protein